MGVQGLKDYGWLNPTNEFIILEIQSNCNSCCCYGFIINNIKKSGMYVYISWRGVMASSLVNLLFTLEGWNITMPISIISRNPSDPILRCKLGSNEGQGLFCYGVMFQEFSSLAFYLASNLNIFSTRQKLLSSPRHSHVAYFKMF